MKLNSAQIFLSCNSIITPVTEMMENKFKFPTSFKMRGKAVKQQWTNKVVCHRLELKDGLDNRYSNFLTIYYPKLHPKHKTPNFQFHASNGRGSWFMRFKDPEDFCVAMEDLIATVRSEKWMDAWWHVNDVAQHLADNELLMDEEVVDINEWKRALEDQVDISLVGVNYGTTPK